jgi:hypothetical protein
MARLTLSLPEYLQEFIDAERTARGPLSRGEFVEQLVLKAYLEKHREHLEPLLLQGLQGPMTPLTPQDWQDIRRRIRDRLAAEKEQKRQRA